MGAGEGAAWARVALWATGLLATIQLAAAGESVEAVGGDDGGVQYGATTQQLLTGRFSGLKVEDFYVEIVSVVSLLLFAINYWSGQAENVKLATKWIQSNKDALLRNFSLVGDGDGLLIKGGPNKFVLWCSGRINCKYMLGVWQMRRRHDLVSSIYNLVSPDYDTLTIEVQPEEDGMSPYVFCLARTKQERTLRDTFKDLQDYGNRMNSATLGVPDSFVVLADSAEAAERVMGSGLKEVVDKYGDYIEFIHLSDQYQEPMQDDKKDENDKSLPEPEKRLRFCFKVPRNGSIADMQGLTEFVISFIDNARISLSANAKAKADKMRAKAAKERQKTVTALKQEDEQRRKDEKRAEEKKAAEQLGPEALRKLEEKEQRKEKKRMANRAKARVAVM